MDSKFEINLGNLKIDQLGFIFRDIEKQTTIMETLFNVPKFVFTDVKTSPITYRGKDSQLTRRIALSRMKGVQLELIQWFDGESAHKEFLDQGREGLHHIATYVEDVSSCVKDFQNKGIDLIQTGVSVGHLVAYMDTEDTFGVILEFMQRIKRRRKKL